ncbi:MAG: NifU family protein [Candidatus Ryanbacteria bacterium]|nr:NifU family protein [Candidatus Ryanbacteria bacterium]
MESEIKKILEKEVRPFLALHRGDLDFISFEDGVVQVRLKGTCKGCPLSTLTLKEGIEVMLKERLNGIDRVEAVE